MLEILTENKKVLKQEDIEFTPEFLKEVEKECNLIKEHFTEEEISKININNLDGNHASSCVYGLMTGTCNNQRVFDFILNYIDVVITDGLRTVNFDDVNHRSYYSILTPLEFYILATEDEADEEFETMEYPDSYYDRIRHVVNLLKKNK